MVSDLNRALHGGSKALYCTLSNSRLESTEVLDKGKVRDEIKLMIIQVMKKHHDG
jgi:hypothetical protein